MNPGTGTCWNSNKSSPLVLGSGTRSEDLLGLRQTVSRVTGSDDILEMIQTIISVTGFDTLLELK